MCMFVQFFCVVHVCHYAHRRAHSWRLEANIHIFFVSLSHFFCDRIFHWTWSSLIGYTLLTSKKSRVIFAFASPALDYPALRRQRQEDQWVRSQPGLPRELQNCHTEKPWLKKLTTTTNVKPQAHFSKCTGCVSTHHRARHPKTPYTTFSLWRPHQFHGFSTFPIYSYLTCLYKIKIEGKPSLQF